MFKFFLKFNKMSRFRLLVFLGIIPSIILVAYFTKDNYSMDFSFPSTSENTGTWILSTINGTGDQTSKKWAPTNHNIKLVNRSIEIQRATFQLLQRDLLLFTIREINLRIAGTSCTKLWANPLTVKEIVLEQNVVTNVTKYKLIFQAQPGAIPFESIVNVRKNYPNATHRYVSDDFVFISARRRPEHEGECQNVLDLDLDIKKMCLCPEETAKAELHTRKIRRRWSVTDPEHPDWPPDATAMVPDFLSPGRSDVYIKTPNQTLNFCGPDLKMLIFVSSAPRHGHRRRTIRKTFGNPVYLEQNKARLVFSFARFEDPKLQIDVDNEAKTYGDIVQSDFKDHYQNQSLGELFLYNWLVTHCHEKQAPMPLWLLKADDDSFLNIPLAIRVAESNPTAEIIGCQDCPHSVMRDGKAHVPKYMYAPTYYFGFVYGGAVLMRTSILEPMLKASLTSPIVNLCDVYITGILAKQIGVYPLNSALFQTSLIIRETWCSKQKFMVNTHAETSQLMTRYWEALHQPSPKECTFDEKLLVADPVTPQKRLDCFYE